MNIEQLNTDYGIAGQLKIVEGKGGFPVIAIENSKAKALISIYAGQVLSFQPAGESADLMFLSENAYYKTGKAMKGGIPICWPWFGPDPEGLGRASHGFVRNRLWDVLSTEATPNGDTKVKLGVTASDETREIWPHTFELVLEIVVGTRLTVALTTHNKGDQAFSITQALHTYFTIGDINQVKVLGLEDVAYLDKVDDGAQKDQVGAVTISEEVDRIYTLVKPELVIDDPALSRHIRITTEGSHTTIVWNPWKEISAKMADLEEQDYQRFICVETANAADEVIKVSPGSQYRMKVTYAIEHS
ncbi:MAG: D-hexose-6-phosphate mutarotase [Cyanobacteria bacterium P01_A01_bin.114]